MASENNSVITTPLAQLAENLMRVAEGYESGTEYLSDSILQKILEASLKIYSNRVQMADHKPENIDKILKPLCKQHKLSQTDAIIFVDHLLKQIDIELFEVQMFRSIG